MAKGKSEHDRITELEAVVPDLELQVRKLARGFEAIVRPPAAAPALPVLATPALDVSLTGLAVGAGVAPILARLAVLPDFESGAFAAGAKLFAVQVQSAAAKRKADALTDFGAGAVTPPGNASRNDISAKEDKVNAAKTDIESALAEARAAGGLVFGAALAARKFAAARADIEAAQASFDEAEVDLDAAKARLDAMQNNNTDVNRLNNAIKLNQAMAKLKSAAAKIKADVVNLKSAAAAIT